MRRTSMFLPVLGIGVATWLTAAPASADQPSPQDQTQGQQDQGQGSMVKMGEKMSSVATVVKVDMANRHLTLRDEKGKEFKIEVPNSVKRLDEIKTGDKIRVDYYESVAVSLKKAQGAPTAGEATVVERKSGKLPNGEVIHTVTATVDIVKIDKANNKVTIRKPDGDTDTLEVKESSVKDDLSKLKEGDRIQATYTEGAAITVMREDQGQPGNDNQQGQGQMPESQDDSGIKRQ